MLVVSFLSLGLRAGLVVAMRDPAGAGRHLRVHGVFRHHAAAHLARRADHRARPAGRRRHDLGRDDGGAARGRRRRSRRRRPSPTRSTAFPMLTGTLVTVAGFVPIGLNGSSAGEYTFTLFAVIASSLLISWVVAVLFTPLLGVTMLPKPWPPAAGRAKPVARQASTRCCSLRCGGAGSPSASRSRCSPLSVFGLRLCAAAVLPGRRTGPSCWST